MAKRYLTAARAVVGTTLPWNIFNEEGILLLKAGEEITSELQAHRLATQGLYFDEGMGTSDMGQPEREPPSVVRTINLAHKLLQQALPALLEQGDAEAQIKPVAQLLLDALDMNPEVAVATIFLNQDAAPYVYRHCVDTAIIAALIGRAMNQPADDTLITISAALTQNIGMLKYQDALNSKRAALSEQELTVVHQHPVHGVNILAKAGVTNEQWLSCVLHHHESEDGSGYPHGKVGDDLPLGAKLIGFSDRYCARLADKKYAKPILPNAAMREILVNYGNEIPLVLAAHFIKVIGQYPPGTAVRLKNGETGVVLKKSAPPNGATVRVTISRSGMPVNEAVVRDTETTEFAIKEEVPREEAGASLLMSRLWGPVAAA
jgi:HD-GYP domain-containing protein (c-di-GMP phosphodiesterase class II)